MTLISPLLISLLILRRIASQFSVTGASSESSSELSLLSESDSDWIAEKGRLDVAMLIETGACLSSAIALHFLTLGLREVS